MPNPTFLSASTDYNGLTVAVLFTVPGTAPLAPQSANIPGFSLTVNGTPHSVTTASVEGSSGAAGNTVLLTSPLQLTYGDTVTVGYTPGSPALTDSAVSPNAVATFSGGAVTNNTVIRTPPTFLSAASSTDGNTVNVVFTDANYPPMLPASGNVPGFTVSLNGVTSVCTAVRLGSSGASGNTYVLTPASRISYGDTLLVSYTQTSPILSDSVSATYSGANPNYVASFANESVTNNTLGRHKPIPSTGITDTAGTYVDITFSQASPQYLPLIPSSAPHGFVLQTNGSTTVPITSIVLQSDHLTYRFTVDTGTFGRSLQCDDVLTLSYTAVSDSNHVSDSCSIPNYLASFSAFATITNIVIDTIAPTLSIASTTTDGNYVQLIFTEDCSPPILPGSGITGFSVTVNGAPRGVVSAVRAGASGTSAKTIRIALTLPVKYGDRITVSYNASTGNVTDSADSPNSLASFTDQNVTNQVAFYQPPLFDAEYWLRGTQPPATTDLYEWRLGCPEAVVTIDTVAPQGYAILNENLSSGGINVHEFDALDGSGTLIAESDFNDVLQDSLDNTIRNATNFGGAANESAFESIGVGSARSLVKYFAPSTSVGAIVVGATAPQTKSYILEAKSASTAAWVPFLYMVADNRTRPYFKYTFSSASTLYAVRMRYMGDFYAASPTGTVTVSAYDTTTDVASIMLSHYPDFRDATEFPNADGNGWIPFSSGTSLFAWQLINQKRVWTNQTGHATEPLTKLLPMSAAIMIAASPVNLYTLTSTGALTQVYAAAMSTSFLSFSLYQTALYVGQSNGTVLNSVDGINYTVLPFTITDPDITSPPPVGINSLASFRSLLYIGANASTSSGMSRLYTWDGSNLKFIRSFSAPYITSLYASGGTLLVGLGGTTAGFGQIYAYDGSVWSQSHVPNIASTAVDKIGYSTADTGLWAGYHGGLIYTSPINSAGAPTAWTATPRHQSAAADFLDFTDDAQGTFFWLSEDTQLEAFYHNAANSTNTFLNVQGPFNPPMGLTARFWNKTSSTYSVIDTTVTPTATITDGPVSWTDFTTTRPAGVNSTYFNARWDGYFVANTTEIYQIYVRADDGVRLYLNNVLVIDHFITETATEYSTSIALTAGTYVPIRIEYYQYNSAASLTLSWSSTTVTKQVIPLANLASSDAPIQVNSMAYFNSSFYGAGADGNVYALDTSTITTKERRIFVRYQDTAGNATDASIFSTGNFSGGNPTGALLLAQGMVYDGIIEDVQLVNGVRVANGQIHQVDVSGVYALPPTQPQQIALMQPASSTDSLVSPDRTLIQSGVFESDPFFAATLTHWSSLDVLAVIPAGSGGGGTTGLEQGTSVDVYVRSGDSQTECISATYIPLPSPAMDSINNPGGANTSAADFVYNLTAVQGKWIQYKLVLTSATRNITPVVQMVTLSYSAAEASYFFTNVFDTSNTLAFNSSNTTPAPPYPLYTRGLLTANQVPNGGLILFGYTTDETPGNVFDFSRYTPITPNTIFTLPTPSQNLRFGILMVSVNTGSEMSPSPPAIVYDLAVMLDAGTADIRWMS